MRAFAFVVAIVALTGCSKGAKLFEKKPSDAKHEENASAGTAGSVTPPPSAAAVDSAAPAGSATIASAAITPVPMKSVALTPSETSGLTPQISADLEQAGVKPTGAGLNATGSGRSMLLRAAASLSPKNAALKYMLNSDTATTAFMSRPEIQNACTDDAAMRSAIAFTLSSPSAQSFVTNADAVSALATSKVVQALQKCESFKRLSAKNDVLAGMMKDNPAMKSVVKTPNFAKGLKAAKISQKY